MKINGNYLQPIFKVTDKSRKEIDNIREGLIYDLDTYQEYEREELYAEIENDYTPSIKIEKLERIKLDTQNNLAFNSHFFEEKCFFINDNGHAKITDNEQLFFSFVHSYKMREDVYKGRAVARNIIKARLIVYIIGTFLNAPETSTKHYSHRYFKKLVSETFFNFCLENTTEKVNRRFVSSLYGYLRGELKGTQYEFAVYWNDNYDYFSFPIYPLNKAGMDTYKGEKDDRFTTVFNYLKDDFENIKGL